MIFSSLPKMSKLVKENPKYFPELPNPWSWKRCSITLSWDEGCRNGALYTLFFHFHFPDGENLALDFSASCSPKSKCRIGFLLLLTAEVSSFFCFLFANVHWIFFTSINQSLFAVSWTSLVLFFFFLKKGLHIRSLIYRLLWGWIFLGFFWSPFLCQKQAVFFSLLFLLSFFD